MPSLIRPLQLRTQAVLISLALAASGALAAFPDKPIRLVVPFAPGGGTDLIARTLAVGMGKELGQQVIIDNKPGAGTIIGTDSVAKSPADGYTIVIATFAHAVNPSMVPKLPYSPEKDFAPITLIGKGPNVLVVRAESPFKSLKDLLAAAKANPGKLNYASQGNGTSAHLAGEMFTEPGQSGHDPRALSRCRPRHQRFAGRSGGHDLRHGCCGVRPSWTAASCVRWGSPRQRLPRPSKVWAPIARDVSGYQVESWYGLYAPAGTPSDVIAKLQRCGQEGGAQPGVLQEDRTGRFVRRRQRPCRTRPLREGEEARWRKIVKENNIKPD